MDINKLAIARLEEEGGEFGTAFLISPKYVLTARHIVESRDVSNLKLCFPYYSQTKTYNIEAVYFDENVDVDILANDIAILELSESIEYIDPLPLDFSSVKENRDWHSFGYPNAQREIGEPFKGTIHNILAENLQKTYDINLFCKEPEISDSSYTITGASGAPIMCNGKVIAIFSNESTGAVVGAATIQRSRSLLESYVPISELEKDLNGLPLQKAIEQAASNTVNLIEGFPDELHDLLNNELVDLQKQFLDNLDDVEWFLANSKYPQADEETIIDGLEAIFEVVLLIKSIYGNIHLLKNDDFANIQVKSHKNFSMSFVYAQKRQEKMPEILLEMHDQMMSKSAAEILIEADKPIPPNPVIFDNCSRSKRFNLCNCCGQPFEFQQIIKTFLEPEDSGIIKGIETNNFDLLNKVRVLCADCIRDVQNQVETHEELGRVVGEKIYG